MSAADDAINALIRRGVCGVSTPKRGDWINTFTGRKFYPLDDEPGEIVLEDIAHALSNLCRYNGHTRKFYSVAEHSVTLVSFASDVVDNEQLERYLLLHDASEAYLSDLPRPLKKLPEFAFYREVEARLQAKIYRRFGLDPVEPAMVRELDTRIQGNEAHALMAVHPDWKTPEPLDLIGEPRGWEPDEAKVQFLGWAHLLGLS